MLACPASFFKKDSRQAPLEKIFLMGQAGMTVSVILLMNSLVSHCNIQYIHESFNKRLWQIKRQSKKIEAKELDESDFPAL